jgi:hypothetical protein
LSSEFWVQLEFRNENLIGLGTQFFGVTWEGCLSDKHDCQHAEQQAFFGACESCHLCPLASCENTMPARENFDGRHACHNRKDSRRMLKKAVQQGRSERRAEAYPLGYVEGLNDARTLLADFFSILLDPVWM